MFWLVSLVAVLPLVLYLVDGDWGDTGTQDAEAGVPTGPDVLDEILKAGDAAEPVWGAWVRVPAFDPASDVLMIEAAADTEISHSASAEGETYLMLTDGTRIVLENLPELPGAPEDFVFFINS